MRESVTLTPTQVKVFELLENNDSEVSRSALAKILWGKSANDGVVVNAYAKSAGSLLGKYVKAGWLTPHDRLTEKARTALAAYRAERKP